MSFTLTPNIAYHLCKSGREVVCEDRTGRKMVERHSKRIYRLSKYWSISWSVFKDRSPFVRNNKKCLTSGLAQIMLLGVILEKVDSIWLLRSSQNIAKNNTFVLFLLIAVYHFWSQSVYREKKLWEIIFCLVHSPEVS